MDIDSSCFKAFQTASQTLNFTEAARLIGMTQSGISQHIAKLESEVGTELFLRVGKKVILTEAGKTLLTFIENYQDQIISLKESIFEGTSALKGKISYAMPATCLLSPHFSLFLDYRKSHFPQVDINVDLHSSEEVIQKVIEAKIDFGFVTKKLLNEDLTYQNFCEEEYVLISSSKTQLKDLYDQTWVHYPGSSVLTEAWLNHPKNSKGPKFKVNIGSFTNSLHAAFTMVVQQLGIMVVPRHCVEVHELRSKIKIHELTKTPCRNMIYIVSLKSDSRPKRVQAAIDAFIKIKN